MTPALLLWISWMALLLRSSHGFQIQKDGLYRPLSPAQNLQDDDDFTLIFDEGDGNSLNKQRGSVYTSFNVPPVAQPPNFVLASQNVPNAIWQPPLQYPSVDPKPSGLPSSTAILWSAETNKIKQPTIQYPPVNAKPVWSVQGSEVGQPTSPLNAEPPGFAEFVLGNEIVPPSQYTRVYAKPPASASVSTAMWSIQGNEMGQPTIQYPPVNVPFPSSEKFVQGNEIASSSSYAFPPKKQLPQGPVRGQPSSWMDFDFSNFFGDEDFNDVDFQPQNSVEDTDTIWVPVMAEEPYILPPHPRNFIVHSKNGYKRGRVVHTKTFYSPDYEKPKMSGTFMGSAQKVKEDAKICPRCT